MTFLAGFEVPDRIMNELRLRNGDNVNLNHVVAWLLEREISRYDYEKTIERINSGEDKKDRERLKQEQQEADEHKRSGAGK